MGDLSNPIQAWHEVLHSRNPSLLDDLLAEDAVFLSPVVHTPQVGNKIVKAYLKAALHVLATPKFTYLREIHGERDAMLEFETEIDGVLVNGVDIISWNEAGKITEFKVMVRPLKAIQAVHAKMADMLQLQGKSA